MAQDNTAPEGIDLPEMEDFIEASELDALRAERNAVSGQFKDAASDEKAALGARSRSGMAGRRPALR